MKYRLLGVICIGAACAVLQPVQPRSAIATVLLTIAYLIATDSPKTT